MSATLARSEKMTDLRRSVLDRLAVDTWFAQAHLDVQAVPPTGDPNIARLADIPLAAPPEQIGDSAGEIAASIQN
jgi:hypothetical protein